MTAAEALATGDFDEALRLLLGLWAEQRSPGLAALIEDVSTHVTKLVPPIEYSDKPDGVARWMAIARERKPSDVGRLLAPIPVPAFIANAIQVQTEELATLPPDPRIAAFLVRLVEPQALRVGGNAAAKVFTRAAKGLEVHADPRRLDDLERIAKDPWYSRTAEARRLVGLASALRDRWTPPPPEPPDLAAVRAVAWPAKIAKVATPPRSAESLLAEIYANPDDDAPRMVYADLLAQRDDPRGEFITLQLQAAEGRGSPAATKRANGLLRDHRAAWLGPLAGVVVAGRTEWARGFPVATRPSVTKQATAEAAFSREEWATFERIDFGGASLLTATMRALRSAIGVGEAALRKLGTVAPPLEELALELDRNRELRASQPTIAIALARFPKLRSLTLASSVWKGGEGLPAFVEAVAPRLTYLAVHGAGIPAGAIADVIAANAHGLGSFGWGSAGKLFVVRRDDAGKLAKPTSA